MKLWISKNNSKTNPPLRSTTVCSARHRPGFPDQKVPVWSDLNLLKMANTCRSQTSIRDRCSYCQKSGEYWLLIGWESENESSNLRLLLVTRFSHVWFIYILDTDSENKELPHFKKVPHTCVNSKISNHTISWEEIINTFHGNNEPVIKRKLVNHVPVTFSLEKLNFSVPEYH